MDRKSETRGCKSAEFKRPDRGQGRGWGRWGGGGPIPDRAVLSEEELAPSRRLDTHLGESGLRREGGDSESGERGHLRRLDDDAVSGGERGSELPSHHEDGCMIRGR